MRLWKEQKAQALTEFALLVPVLLLLICGLIDFGRVAYSYMHLNLATQESVRLGGLGKTDAEIDQFARNYVHTVDPALLEVIVSPGDAQRPSGTYVTVTLRAPFEFITPFAPLILPNPYTVVTESTIRVE